MTTTKPEAPTTPAVDPKTIRAKASLVEVRRVSHFRAKNDIRYYLAGILIERAPEGGVFIVATDGHRMAISHDPLGMIDGADSVVLRVTPGLLSAKPPRGRSPEYSVVLREGRASVAPGFDDALTQREIAIQAGPGFLEVGKHYPLWRKILPNFDALKELSGQFNLAYLGEFGQCVTDGRLAGARLWQADPDSIIAVQLVGYPHFLGLLMPQRADRGARGAGLGDLQAKWIQHTRAK